MRGMNFDIKCYDELQPDGCCCICKLINGIQGYSCHSESMWPWNIQIGFDDCYQDVSI